MVARAVGRMARRRREGIGLRILERMRNLLREVSEVRACCVEC